MKIQIERSQIIKYVAAIVRRAKQMYTCKKKYIVLLRYCVCN
jgi:hypothetical protein